MSKSDGNSIAISELAHVLPPEVIRFFTLRYSPDKQLFFSEVDGVIKLIDEFAELLAKPDKTAEDKQLLRICTTGVDSIVSSVPFSHLVTSYQASLKDADKTLDIIGRTEHNQAVQEQADIIRAELKFIEEWLERWAPEDVKFELLENPNFSNLSDAQKQYLSQLADKIAVAPNDAEGEWFHQAIYDLKDKVDIQPKELFITLYRVLINKDSGPRAGWFLSLLSRDWLIKRLRLLG